MLKVYFTWHTTAKPRLGIRLVLTVSVTAKENKPIITQLKYGNTNRTFAMFFFIFFTQHIKHCFKSHAGN